MNTEYTKWVSCWGNATSIIDQKECVYAKNLTLRYPILMCFDGSQLRLRFSNLTGTEPVTITKAYLALKTTSPEEYAPVPVTFSTAQANTTKTISTQEAKSQSATIQPGQELSTDPIPFPVKRGQTIEVSLYLSNCTQMNSGTLITGPLSGGQYAYGDFAAQHTLPLDLTRNTNWYYFLNTIDILTEEKNHALICYGDSITAQSWPDYLTLRTQEEGFHNVAIIRRAVSGTRILRQYDCITYAAYGLKGATRFPIEMNVSGASAVIIQHGINDIIHPVGTEVNPFRPMDQMPTAQELSQAVTELYINHARKLGLKIYSGTLLPIYGWRTYAPFREEVRTAYNHWLRTSPLFNGCIDFDQTLRDPAKPESFAPGYDSGDHLHPSESAYKAMAHAVPEELLK